MPRVFRKPGRTVYLTRFKINGHRYELSTKKRDPVSAAKAARRIYADKIREDRPTARLRNQGRLEDLSVMDLENVGANGACEETVRTQTIQWANVLAFFGPDTLACDVTPARLADYVKHRRACTFGGVPIKGQTIRRELSFLRRGLVIAESKGWLARLPAPWPKLKADPKNTLRSGRFIPPEALRVFVMALPDWLAEEMMFDVMTGLRGGSHRGGELRRVTDSWAEPAPAGFPTPAILRVPAWASKTRKERTVGLPAPALAIFDRRVKATPAGEPLFPYRWAIRARRAAAKKAGLSIVPHRRDLRHTFATLGDYLTGDRKGVQDAMGHSTESMTGHYVHGWDSRTAAIGAAVSRAVNGGDGAGVTVLAAEGNAGEKAGPWCYPNHACPSCGCVGSCRDVQRYSATLHGSGGDAPGVTLYAEVLDFPALARMAGAA